jgi:tetratricopeptide (TPR) repeat protein
MPLYASFSTRPDQDDSLFGALLLEELLGALPSDKPEHAIAIGRRILTYNPESEAAWAVLIADSADESAGRKLLRECPSWVGTRMLAARARSRGDESAYESLLRQRISSEPSHAEAYIELAQFLGEKGRPSEAQALFRQACLLSPHHPGIPESILEESTLDNSLSIGIRPQLPRQGPPLEVSAWSPQVRSCLAKAAGKKGPALRRTLLTVSPDFFEVDRIIARGSILSAQQAHLLDLCRHLGDAPRRLLGAAPGRATWVESVGDMYQALIPTNHNFPFARVLWELNELTNHALCLDPHGEYLNLQRMLDRLKGTNEGARRAYRRCASLIQAAGDGAGGPHVDAALKYLSEQLDAFHDVVQHELIPSVTNDLPAALERWLNAFSAIEPEEFTRADSQPVAEHSP